jgi:hypothetical protein
MFVPLVLRLRVVGSQPVLSLGCDNTTYAQELFLKVESEGALLLSISLSTTLTFLSFYVQKTTQKGIRDSG